MCGTIKDIPQTLTGGTEGHDRNPGRSVSAAQGVRAHEPGARRGRRAEVRQPPKRRGRGDAPDRSRPGQEARTARVSVSAGRLGWHPRDAFGASAAAQAMGPAGRAALEDAERHRGSGRVLPRVGREAGRSHPRAAVRHRRGRHQARQHRAARQARHDVEISAMGGRVQVSAGAVGNDADADRHQRRAHGRRHAVCRARTGLHRRHDRVDGDTPQRQRGRPEGRSRRRSRHGREGGRHHPAGRSCRRSRSRGPRGALGDADALSALPERARARRGRSGVALREHVLSREAAARARTLRGAACHEHRGPRRVADRAADCRWPDRQLRRRLQADPGAARAGRAVGEEIGRQSDRSDSSAARHGISGD